MSDEVNQNHELEDEFAFLEDTESAAGQGAEQETPEITKTLQVNLRHDPIKEVIDGLTLNVNYTLPLSNILISEGESTEKGSIAGDEKQRLMWSTVISDIVNNGWVNEQSTLSKERMETGEWHQGLLQDGDVLRRPASLIKGLGDRKTTIIDSDFADALLDDAEESATTATVRCYSMGVAFRIKKLPLTKLSTLFNRIATDKRVIGVETAGAGYSAESTYLDENLVTLVKSLIINANIEKFKIATLDEILTDQGLDELLIGIAALMYQDGFEFSRACVKNPEACTHVTQGKLDILDSIWVDNNLLSDEQRKYWGKPVHTLAEVKAYRDGFAYHDETLKIGKRMVITYADCLLKDKISSGKQWISRIYNSLTDAFEMEPSSEERKTYLRDQMNVAIVGAYVPYIKSIEIFDKDLEESKVIESQEAIREALLRRVGVNDELIGKVIEGALKFQSTNRLTAFGPLNYECPQCGTPQSSHHGAFGTIIPYNPRITFMNLGVLRVKRR